MVKWEYKFLDSSLVADPKGILPKPKSIKDIEAYLNQLGAEGWEIVNIDFRELSSPGEFFGVAKRPLPDGSGNS